jgi:hypothetical protein
MARRTRQRITVPVEFDRWIEGLENLDPGDEIAEAWDDAMQIFYGRSQESVHVISNALRTTGRYEVTKDGRDRVNGDLIYGGQTVKISAGGRTRTVDYAIYEHNRGGDHAWMTVAFAQVRARFEQALLEGIDSHVRKFL